LKNWKTSLFGVISALAGFAIASPELFTKWVWVVPVSKFIMAGGLAGMGFVAKDGSTHSTPAEVQEAGWKE
jgi:hypothetical protein